MENDCGKKILDFTESKGADFILAISLLDLHPFQSLWNALLQRGRSREHLKVITGRAEASGRLASDKPRGRGRGEYCFSTPLGIKPCAVVVAISRAKAFTESGQLNLQDSVCSELCHHPPNSALRWYFMQ